MRTIDLRAGTNKGSGMARPTNANRNRATTRPGDTGQGASGSGRTIKQQREAKRAEKVAELRRVQTQARRRRLIGIIAGATAVAIVIAGIITFMITSGTGKAPATAISGVRTFTGLTSNHVTGPVTYQQTPPVGGNHSAVWLNCGVYGSPVPNENAVHSLEHGAVWVTYDSTRITGSQLTTLRNEIPSTYAILSPYPGLPAPVVASAWGAQLQLSRVDDPRLAQFLAKYRSSASAPEPGGPCTGGMDAPGKLR